MKHYPGIDYDYRPVSYWNDETLAQAILKNVKGELRREKIRQALEEGSIEDIPEEILGDALADNVRTATGRIHPWFMGGEFLPDCAPGEVEIARISLESTTHDIISLRAGRKDDGTIGYTIADEYEGMSSFHLSRQSSELPLTLALRHSSSCIRHSTLDSAVPLCLCEIDQGFAARQSARRRWEPPCRSK